MTVSQIWAAGDRLTLGLEDVLGGAWLQYFLGNFANKQRTELLSCPYSQSATTQQ